MNKKRFTIHGDVVSDTDMKIPITVWSDKKQQKKFCNELNALHDENEQLKQQINTIIDELQAEKETAISRNERIRLDFAITVLEELKGG